MHGRCYAAWLTERVPEKAAPSLSSPLVPKVPPPKRARPTGHLVVDGSNIATEGRTLPSMAQLEEAVEAFLAEHGFEVVTVIVDATFGHRIDKSERDWYEEAIEANHMITPPAGAIGRGDAFILEVARRAGATVLSNDSFQEFHGTHPWLFDPGRLYGGKHIPHVGWVFVARSPVRGPTSRRAVRSSKDGGTRRGRTVATETKAATARGATAPDAAMEEAIVGAAAAATHDGDTEDAVATGPTRRRPSRRRTAATPVETTVDLAATDDVTTLGASQADDRDSDDDSASGSARRRGRRRGGRGRSRTRDTVATTERADEAPSTPAPIASAASSAHIFNTDDTYRAFIDAHPVGSTVDVTVERFSSHGAYGRCDDVECYMPTRLLGDPPPARARDVLRVGDAFTMVVHAFHDATRGIDLAGFTMSPVTIDYDGARRPSSISSSIEPSADETSETGTEQPTRRGTEVAAKKAAKKAVKKAPAKKAAKKAPAKKAAKKAPAKRVAKKAPAKKAPAKKAAKKAPAKRVAKKAPAKKAAAKKAAKKAPAKRTAKKAAKKAPAKRAAKKAAPRRAKKA